MTQIIAGVVKYRCSRVRERSVEIPDRAATIGKSTMTRSKTDDNSVLLVHAYLTVSSIPPTHWASRSRADKEPALAAEADEHWALQQGFTSAPRARRRHLAAGVEASVGGLRKTRVRQSTSWRALAASIRSPRWSQHLNLARGWVSPTIDYDRGRTRFRSHPRADGAGGSTSFRPTVNVNHGSMADHGPPRVSYLTKGTSPIGAALKWVDRRLFRRWPIVVPSI